MGREIRRVPMSWVHPVGPDGNHLPMREPGKPFDDLLAEWAEAEALWLKGQHPDQLEMPADTDGLSYTQWNGGPPDPAYYMPHFTHEEATGFQMYEDTSEGTPISPVFATIEEVARWCADNGASRFGSDTADYEEWLRIARGGFSGLIMVVGGDS